MAQALPVDDPQTSEDERYPLVPGSKIRDLKLSNVVRIDPPSGLNTEVRLPQNQVPRWTSDGRLYFLGYTPKPDHQPVSRRNRMILGAAMSPSSDQNRRSQNPRNWIQGGNAFSKGKRSDHSDLAFYNDPRARQFWFAPSPQLQRKSRNVAKLKEMPAPEGQKPEEAPVRLYLTPEQTVALLMAMQPYRPKYVRADAGQDRLFRLDYAA